MKKKLTLVTFAAAFAAMFGMNLDMAAAQFGAGPQLGNQVYQPDTFRRVAADLNVGLPGRLWVSSNFADQGLGYEGSYLTVGGKRRLFEDFLDGRWLTEARLHHSIEDDGGFFANVGIERVFSIKAADAEVATGFWYDFDGDQQGNFGHDFSQVGVNAAIKTRRWDLVGNGYFPVGVRNFTSNPIGGSPFFGNNIAIAPGIDSALTGFDVTMKLRPRQLAFMNGTFEIGGYGYSSDLVNSFGGGRIRLGAQGRRGLIVTAEVNHDDRFETTGALSVGYVFGAVGGNNSEYAGIGRDLEETLRNDHIVRFNQDVQLAIDPATGQPYNVIHVDNTADDSFETGSAETPFDSLVDAQNNSSEGDLIFVNVGDGTDRLLDQGIVLQNNQQLLSGGGQLILPTLNDGLIEVSPAGVGATISNPGGSAVVRVADGNTIAGINIDATGANSGIAGNGFSGGLSVQSTTVTGADNDGILLTQSEGEINIGNSTVSNNGRDGIRLNQFLSDQITLTSNTTSGNSRHGVFLSNASSPDTQIDIVSATSTGNSGFGVLVTEGNGNLNVIDPAIDNNVLGGLRTLNFTSNGVDQRTFVGLSDPDDPDAAGSISGNTVGSNIEFELNRPGLTQDVLVTGISVDDGGRGITAITSGAGTQMNLDIIDTASISSNDTFGVLVTANDSSRIDTNILSTIDTLPLQIIDNGIVGGDGISLNAVGTGSALLTPAAEVNGRIENVRIQLPGNSAGGSGISVTSTGNAFADVAISDADIERIIVGDAAIPNNFDVNDNGLLTGGDFGIFASFANVEDGEVNRLTVRDTMIEADNGIGIITQSNTLSDILIADSVIQAVGPRAVGRDDGLDNPTTNSFGDVGVVIVANDTSDNDNNNITRVDIRRTLIQDFSGVTSFGLGDFGFNGLFEALPGSAIDVRTNGDANLVLGLSANSILNNGAGFIADMDNDGFFGEQPIVNVEGPDSVLFFDAVRINAFDQSTITTRITGNFFQDNFERAIALDTYDSGVINAQVVGNAFDNNDRGNDPNRTTFRTNPDLMAMFNPLMLTESQNFDFEAINNEEFFQRAYESPLAINGMMDDVLDADMNMIADQSFNPSGADSAFTDGIFTARNAQINLDLRNNGFEFGTVLVNFNNNVNDFRLSGTPAPGGINGVGVGVVETIISAEEANADAVLNP